jgi:glutathione synthase/RimK-type ligase-like ATP-grasp enzyme
MRIAFLVKPRGETGTHSVVPEVSRILAHRGLEVDLIDPEARVTDLTALRPEYDLYVLKARTNTTLSIAGALHEAGAAILNPYPVAAACRDKVVASQLLRAARVPVPETYVAGHLDQLAPLLEWGPIVVKPYRGSQGRGVRVVRRVDEVAGDSRDEGPVFAQRYHEPTGRDRKVYRIGDRIFGVERVWPARTQEEKRGEPFVVDNEIRELALRLGGALGITLYGFDVVLTADGPYVVDFSPFPGFKGVPDAAALLADYIHDVAARVVNGGALLATEAHDPVPA